MICSKEISRNSFKDASINFSRRSFKDSSRISTKITAHVRYELTTLERQTSTLLIKPINDTASYLSQGNYSNLIDHASYAPDHKSIDLSSFPRGFSSEESKNSSKNPQKKSSQFNPRAPLYCLSGISARTPSRNLLVIEMNQPRAENPFQYFLQKFYQELFLQRFFFGFLDTLPNIFFSKDFSGDSLENLHKTPTVIISRTFLRFFSIIITKNHSEVIHLFRQEIFQGFLQFSSKNLPKISHRPILKLQRNYFKDSYGNLSRGVFLERNFIRYN